MDTAQARSGERDPPGGLVYDGFISYSHAADDLLAPRLQSGLQRFAKPWWKRRALWIFRDESSLSANPHLWSSITDALDGSGWFVLLLSPEAADSEWVNREVEYWLEHKDADRIIPVVTDGDFIWADGHLVSDAAPPALRNALSDEPRWVDLRFAGSEEQLDLSNPRFSAAIADIASAIHGVPKDQLESEEVRQHRRTVRTAWAAGAVVLALAVVAGATAIYAVDQGNEARAATAAETVARQEAEEAATSEAAQREEAERQTRVAAARGLAFAAAASTAEDPERSLLLALAAAETTRREGESVLGEAVEELHRSLNAHRVLARYPLGGGVAVSPDGSLLAAIRLGEDGPTVIEVRDADSGELVTVLGEGGDLRKRPFDLTFGPDNRTLAIANEADELTVWDALTGAELARVSNEAAGWPRFSPDGSLILFLSNREPYTSAFLWDWEAGELVHRFELPGETWGADFSRDGQLIAIGQRSEGAVVLFEANSGEVVRRIEGHDSLLSSVAFSPDGTRLASVSDFPSRILVSEVATGDALLVMPSPIDAVLEVVWSPDGEELAFGGNTAELAIVNAATGDERLRLSGIDGPIHAPFWFPDGNRIAVTGRPAETVIWDVRPQNAAGGTVVGTPTGQTPAGAWYTDDESTIAVSVPSTGLSLFDTGSNSEVASQTPAEAWVTWPGWPLVSPDGTLAAMANTDGLLTIYDTESLAAIRSFDVGVPIGAFSPDGGSIVVAPRVPQGTPVSDNVRPGLVDVVTGEFILKFDDLGERNWDNVLAIHAAIHPSGDYVAITGPTHVYDIQTGEVVFTPERGANALAFSPDGSRFIMLTGSGLALLYDFDAMLAGATPEEALIREWQALDATGIAVRWTPDGSRLLVGGLDDDLVVFDGEGQKTLMRVATGVVATIDFSDDGERALISTEFGSRIIPLVTEDLLTIARLRLTRGFTPAECAQFFTDGGCPDLGP